MLAVAACLILPGACSSEAGEELPTPNDRKDISLTITEEAVVRDYNEFALNLFNKYMLPTNSNTVISPLSVSMYLSMMANGAEGETRDEILKTLGFDAEELDVANAFFYRLTKELETLDNTTDITIANSIWIDNSFNVNDDFINVNRANYGAEIFREPILTEETKEKINEWARSKTGNQITKFYGEFDFTDAEHNPILSFDALNFKGRWNIPFDKSLTKKGEFTNFDGTKSKVDMMHGKFDCRADFDGKAYWLTLPYGNGAFEMKLVLPKDVVDREEINGEDGVKTYLMKEGDEALNEYFASLTYEKFKSMLGFGEEYNIDITLPKFEFKNFHWMFSELKSLGIEKAFDEYNADFSKISTDKNITIGGVSQKSHFAVDESGTTGAVVTGETWIIAPLDPVAKPEIKTLEFNKPFAFIIRERSTGAVLFMGRVGSLATRQ